MFEHVRRAASVAVFTISSVIVVPAFAASTYSYDFQGTVGSEWSHTTTSSAPNPEYEGWRKFLGEFGNDTVTLSLGDIDPHTSLTVSFELFLIRSWDGNDTTVLNGDALGPDTFQFGVVGGPMLLSETFSNGNPAGQSYTGAFSNYTFPPGTQCTAYAGQGPNAPMSGANECYSLGYTFTYPDAQTPEAMDSVYSLSFTVPHTGSALTLSFAAFGLQGLGDESWGLDNVSVNVTPVPLPGALALFGSGLLAVFGWRRKRA